MVGVSATESATSATVPQLPVGSAVTLPGGATTFVRDSGGPADAPVVLLLHGWLATSDLNWGFSFPALLDPPDGNPFRVVAFDQRGHGRGAKGRKRFNFEVCADDAIAVLDDLGIERAIAVGYSMGGPIALTLARRQPERVAGLVLCATAGAFTSSPLVRSTLAPLGPLASATRLVPDLRVRRAMRQRFIARRAEGPWRDWISAEMEPSDLTTMLEAGAALARFDGLRWAGRLDLPAAMVMTYADELVPPSAQRALARALKGAETYPVDAGHLACFEDPERFAPVLAEACRSVAARSSTN
jgi:pimeloyl-ACP methyl ester carboxylesterase